MTLSLHQIQLFLLFQGRLGQPPERHTSRVYIEGKVSHTPKGGGRNCALDTAGSKTHMDYKGDQIKSVYLTFDSVGM